MIATRRGLGASLWLCCIFFYLLERLSEGCIVTAPSLVRLGANETVLVRNRANAAKNVSLRATDYPAEARLLFTESFLLGGGAEKLVRMKLDETKFAGEDLQHSNHSSFVSLRVHCGDAFDKAAVLLLKPTSGYLFVQTDKPVYSQGEPVKIRIVAVDDALLPSADTVHIEIKNPQDILTYTWDVPSEDPNTGIVSHAYELPKYPMFGKWKVIATYGRHLSEGTARFTVPSDELKNGSDWKDWVHGNRLFVRAVVVEEATGKQEAAQDDSAVFSNSAYNVSLENTRRDFKPGTIVAVTG
nr:complement C3-like [Rhipicephalus microplus]